MPTQVRTAIFQRVSRTGGHAGGGVGGRGVPDRGRAVAARGRAATLRRDRLSHARVAAHARAAGRGLRVPGARSARAPQPNGFGVSVYFVCRYSWMPSAPPSRPSPESFQPPNGAAAFETTPTLSPIIPV